MKLLISFIFVWFAISGVAQNRGDVRIMSYNTENLFDTEDDPLTADDDFTPTGKMRWTKEKYHQKLLNIYKVIAGVGGWQPPEIIGLVEIENRKVLSDLLLTTPLSKYKYGISHYESPDPRGIDVALIFRSDKFSMLYQEPLNVTFINHPEKRTRNILYVKLLYGKSDTLCIFVNHWPSRRGGEIETEDLRNETARILRHRVDQILKTSPSAKIVIMGDFNDEPANESITKYLKAQPVAKLITGNQLYNLSYNILNTSKIGTHTYRGNWSVLDQMIVTGSVINPKFGLYTKPSDIHIFVANFITQPDTKHLGIKPLPTYSGPKYVGGYSDHFPVYLDLYLKK